MESTRCSRRICRSPRYISAASAAPNCAFVHLQQARTTTGSASIRIRTSSAGFPPTVSAYGSNPKTTTASGVPTYTFPFAIIGVTNLSFELSEKVIA